MSAKHQEKSALEAEAEKREGAFLSEIWNLLKHNKKWWLGPIFMVLLLLGVLVLLAGSSAAPFIYTLF